MWDIVDCRCGKKKYHHLLQETISVEVQNTQQVYNSAVMFAKNLGVIVAPDYTAADNFEGITTGIAGGAGLVWFLCDTTVQMHCAREVNFSIFSLTFL